MFANSILESIGDAIYGVATDWSVVFFNRQAEQFFNRPREDVIGRSIWDAFPAARLSEIGDGLRRVMTTLEPLEMVSQSPTTGRWADIRMFPLEYGGIGVSWRDVTLHKVQDAALADVLANRDRLFKHLRTITDHVPAMIAHWDADLKCRFANANYMHWFGRTSEEMLGMPIQDLMGEELFAMNEPYMRRALAGEPQSFERSLIRPSGETGHTWAQYIPEIDDNGRVLGFYALVTDVSPLKAAEGRLREANSQIQAAKEEAEAAAAAKGAFLANISHEFRNPLSVIAGNIDLLASKGGLSEQQQEFANRIQLASGAMSATINDLLDFAKLEAGQVEIVLRPADLAEIGSRALDLFVPDLERKQVTHDFEAVGLPPRLLVDEAGVRPILINLLGNAAKFTDTGQVRLRCLYDSNGGTLRLEVIDTGLGIALDQRSRLFQRYQQVDGSAVRVFGGTGLGLSICKGLAEAMGGRIGVESAPGEGSCFWVEIPAEPAPDASA